MKIYRGITEVLDLGFEPEGTERKELMVEHTISFRFELQTYIKLEKGDSITYNGKKFYLKEDYISSINKSTNGFVYDLKFYDIMERMKDIKLKYNAETDFKLTTTGSQFLDVVVSSFSGITKGSFPEGFKEIHFENLSVFDALNLIAEAYNTEWWLNGSILNISKCEFGVPVLLRHDIELDEISVSPSSETMITRLYAKGSTRNIPRGYSQDNRLKLATGYIDLIPDLPDSKIIEGVHIFEDIYPRQTTSIVEVIQASAGDTPIFTIRGNNTFEITQNDVIAGQPLKIAFNTGNLAGREFELIIRGDNKFEIKYIQEGDLVIPNLTLKPEIGDEFFFFNFNAESVLPTLIAQAENELLVAAQDYLDNLGSQLVYDCVTRSILCEENEIDLEVGQIVTIYSENIGTITSRVRGYTKELFNKYESTYQVGEYSKYSRLKELEDKAKTKPEIIENIKNEIDSAIIKATYWSIRASSPVIYKDAVNAATSGTHTTVTVIGELRRGQTTTLGGYITVTPNGGTEASIAIAIPVTIAPANGDGKTSYTVKLYDTASKTTLLDTMTIPVVFKGASGVNAISAVLSNEADVLPASPEGVVSDYTGSGTEIRVFEGATELSYGTGNGQYQVSAVGSGITVGTPSTSGNRRVYGVASNMTSDNATITFTITGKTASGTSFSLTKVQAFAKSKTGQKGDQGPQGIPGVPGADGVTYYTWIRYADTPTSGMSQYPTGKDYIGIAYNKTTPTESSNYSDYNWSLIKGEQGLPGQKGADGIQYYTWIKYADSPTSGMSDNPAGKAYIGIAVNKTTATESTNYADYTWQLTKGEKGDTGASAPLLYLSASAQVMKCNPDNTPQTGQTVSIEAKLQNVSGTATFVATPYNDAGTALTAITLGGSGNTRTLTNTQWLATYKRIEIVATLGSLNDKVTIYRVADGATGDAGQNAIVGLLTNESVTLQANSAGTVSSFAPANGEFWVYNGVTKVTSGITFSKVSETGCTAAITSAGAYSVSAMSADNATVVLRAVYSGVTIDKVLTISKSRAGADGVSISLVDVEFAKNTNPTTAPTTGWTTTAPTLLDGEQLWTRTKTTYSSGNPTYSTPANITPKKGDTGAVGQGVDSVTEEYAISTSKTTQPTTGWSTTQPTWVQGQYIWSRVKVVYKNPASTVYTGYAVSSEWEAVNNLVIGGRNLIKRSDILNWSNFGYIYLSQGVDDFGSYYRYIFGVLTSAGNIFPDIEFKENTQYVFSAEGMLETGISPWFTVRYTDGSSGHLFYAGTNEPIRVDYITEKGKTVDYIRHSHNSNGFARLYNIQLIEGNKIRPDWTPAPEDVQAEIDSAKQEALTAAGNAQNTANSLKNFTDTAFRDGIIDRSESIAIEKYKNSLNEAMSKAEASYNKVYTNTYLEGTAKTSLLNAKINLWGQRDTLLSAINTAISGGTTTPAQKTSVDNAFSTFNNLMTAFQNALEEANKAIQTKLDDLSTEKVNNLEIGGRNLIREVDIMSLGSNATKGIDDFGQYIRFLTANSGSPRFTHVKYEDNTQYTLSIEASVETGSFLYWWFVYTDGSDSGVFSTIRIDSATPVIQRATSANNKTIDYISYTWASGGYRRIYNIKLEKGNKATDWTPAPEDVDKKISDVDAKAAEAQAKANKSAAITDKFKTEINGGLITTVMMLLREANSQINTAGFSGIQKDNNGIANQPSYWSGGTYEQAMTFVPFVKKLENEQSTTLAEYNNLPSIVFLHNGAAKIGHFIVLTSGEILVIDPATGSVKLKFTTADLPAIADLVSGTNSQGSTAVGGGVASISSSQVVSGSTVVSKNGAIATFNGTHISLSARGAVQAGGMASFAEAVLYARQNGVRVQRLASVTVHFTNTVYEDKSAEVLPVPFSFPLDAGTYTFELVIHTTGTISSGNAVTSASTLSWKHTVAGVKKQQYSKDGMMFFYSNRHFYFNELTGLDVKESDSSKFNMPGVLAAGSSTSTGSHSNVWGAKANPVGITPISGGFRVPLSGLSHSNYVVQITPHTNTTFRVGTKTSTYFEVYGTGGFDYVVIGNNYA